MSGSYSEECFVLGWMKKGTQQSWNLTGKCTDKSKNIMQHTFKNGDRMVKNKEWKEHLRCQFLAQLSIAEGKVLGSVWLCEALLNGGCGKQIRREKLVSVTSVFCVVLAFAEGVKFFLSNLRPVLHGNPFGPVDLGYGRTAFLSQFLLLPSSREL